ncbi:ATP-binding cassette domain-containing protein [Longispora sp. K20-0274]|uniref:ABC transporter ATP-binding protein n=1 Tax=Longispora sp. K20-0274 TaxID=3088255 RepID=UPI003999DBE3
MIVAEGLTKWYGPSVAVENLSFTVQPGRVTGFLGPNGAGKSTTMRMILGLDRPTGGHVTVGGVNFQESAAPLRTVGAVLDAKAVHPGRTAYKHLLALALSNGLPKRRVTEVLETVGLAQVAKDRIGGFSLGMSQRLAIAGALLGDPAVLMFDEPVNGLDPEGIRWIRGLMRGLAAEGRTVFVSSHLLAEMAETADHLIVIGKGRLIADTSVAEFTGRGTGGYTKVRSPEPDRLLALVTAAGGSGTPTPDGALAVTGLDCAALGDLAAEQSLRLHELTPVHASLEETFMELTSGDVSFRAGAAGGTPDTAPVNASVSVEGDRS